MPNMHNFTTICFKELTLYLVLRNVQMLQLLAMYKNTLLQIITISTLIFIHFEFREGQIKMSDWWSNLTSLVWTISPIKKIVFKSKLWQNHGNPHSGGKLWVSQCVLQNRQQKTSFCRWKKTCVCHNMEWHREHLWKPDYFIIVSKQWQTPYEKVLLKVRR